MEGIFNSFSFLMALISTAFIEHVHSAANLNYHGQLKYVQAHYSYKTLSFRADLGHKFAISICTSYLSSTYTIMQI